MPAAAAAPVLGPAGSALVGGLSAIAVTAAPSLYQKIRQFLQRQPKDEEEIDPEPWGGCARHPESENERMSLLRELSLLDTDEHDDKFDDITRVVASILGVPIVLISLVAEDRQWFKSRCGLDANQTGRDVSFCAWTFLPDSPRMLIVPDSKNDRRFAKNPLVLGEPFIRFYAGCPLVTSDGHRLGAFCLIDRVPRVISACQQQLVINFTELIVRQLEETKLAQEKQGDSEFKYDLPPTIRDFEGGKLRADRMRESLSEPLLLVCMNPEDPFWPILYANQAWNKMTKIIIRSGSGYSHLGNGGPQKHFLQCLQPFSTDEGKTKMDPSQALLPELYGSFIRDGVCFGMTCATKTNPKVYFTCRCQPADKPLDAAAEAIQIVRDPDCGAVADPEDAVFNRLYFFIMTKLKDPPGSDCGLSSIQSSAASNGSVGSGSPGQTPVHSDGSIAKKKAFSGSVSTEPEAEISVSQSNDSKSEGISLASLYNIRKPVTPFSDVRLVRMIGKGSFAEVFYGLWIGQPVAVKVAKWTKQPGGAPRPIFEGALSVELSHPNLVQTFKHSSVMVKPDVEELAQSQAKAAVSTEQALAAGIGDQFETWITQEWCDMGTLMKHVDSRPPMQTNGLGEVLGIIVDISSAMTYMHGRSIIHGDLTANNVLLTCKSVCKKGYICKVSDFGLSRILEGDSESIWTQQLGTVTYMPPELFNTDSCKLTQKADIYAIGILMWQVFTGSLPFKNLTPPQVIVRVAQGMGLSLPEDAHPKYDAIFKAATDREPNRRPSAQVVLDTLLEFLGCTDFNEKGALINVQAKPIPAG